MTPIWRAMGLGDLPVVLDVAAQVHPGFPERPEVFIERLALFPEGCRVAVCEDAKGEHLVGYAVMHPAKIGYPPALDSLLGRLAEDADCLYLHDVALLPETRGKGLAKTFVTYAQSLAEAKGLAVLALISVNKSAAMWHSQGFLPQRPDARLAAKLASYEPDATYMRKDLIPRR